MLELFYNFSWTYFMPFHQTYLRRLINEGPIISGRVVLASVKISYRIYENGWGQFWSSRQSYFIEGYSLDRINMTELIWPKLVDMTKNWQRRTFTWWTWPYTFYFRSNSIIFGLVQNVKVHRCHIRTCSNSYGLSVLIIF